MAKMQLPNGNRAVVPPEKLTGYALNPAHLSGRHKARVFARALGITSENTDDLHAALLRAAATGEAALGERDGYGQRYVIDFEMTTNAGSAVVRSAWIIRIGEEHPELVTCYIPGETTT